MARKTAPLLPRTARRLTDLGERLKLARLRRRLTAKMVAERAGMSVMTLALTGIGWIGDNDGGVPISDAGIGVGARFKQGWRSR
jgi:hypothetical protein